MADLFCARTRLPIPGRYTQRVVQVTETVRVQEPPDYVTQMFTTAGGVYCSARCAVLHMAESLHLDDVIDGAALVALTVAVVGGMDGTPDRPTPCVAAQQARPIDEAPF